MEQYPSIYKFPKRKLIEVDVSNKSTKEFKTFYKQMIDYVENFLFQSEQYLFKEKTNKVNSFIISIYKQRFLSSYWSAMATLKGRKENLYKYLAEDLGTDIDLFDDEEFEDEILKFEVSDFELSPRGKEIIESEIRAINNVIKYGEEVEKNKNQINNLDPKISATIEIIEEKINKESFHPILIFSKYTSTLEALEQELFSKFKNLPIEFGMYSGNQIWYSLDGEKFKCKKEDIIQGLNNNLINILLCTEAASEGLNLQEARTLINVDVPWTPSVLEQRIGRIARLGQKADEVEIYLIWYPKSYEQKIYSKLIKKESDYHLAVGMYAQIIEDSIKAQTSDSDNSTKTLEYINKIRKNSEKIGLDKLFNLKLSELEPFGNLFRKGLMSIMESVGEATDNLSHDPNDFKVETVSLNNPNLLLTLKKLENTREITEFNATLFGLIYEDKLWGFVIFFQDKYYLLNPTHLIDVLLSITNNTQFSLTDCIQVEESISLSQLKEKYNKMNLPLTIPSHEKILFDSTSKFTDFELNNELKKLFSLNCSN